MPKPTKRILLTGADRYWNGVAGNLLRRAGIEYEMVTSNLGVLKLLLTGHLWKHGLIYQVNGTRNWLAAFLLGLTGKPFMVHWIGTDVVSFQSGPASKGWRRRLTERLVYKKAAVHLSDSPDLVKELQGMGIEAEVVRLLPERIDAEPSPLPRKFTVLSYWSDGRREFYGGDIVLKLAQKLPEVDFRVLGASQPSDDVPANVTYMGRRDDIEDVYSTCSVLIRLPEHDSLSAMVLESMARGRYVIYNKKQPGCHYAENFEQARDALKDIQAKVENNKEGAEYVRREYSVTGQAEQLGRIVRAMVQQAPK